jgi:bidirectional [NiFe] hydrogenase diaphorase subunit
LRSPGAFKNTGLIEVPMGITLREIIFEIGGGHSGGPPLQGGADRRPVGRLRSRKLLDTPVDYETLTRLGSIMGSGGMIVMDETSSMVDVARYFMEFCMTESCGKCIPCRAGTVQMYNLLGRKFAETPGDRRRSGAARRIVRHGQAPSLCGLGQSAPNPVLSTLRYFRPEYEAGVHGGEGAI